MDEDLKNKLTSAVHPQNQQLAIEAENLGLQVCIAKANEELEEIKRRTESQERLDRERGRSDIDRREMG